MLIVRGKRWGVRSNQADEGTKISWWMWPFRRSIETCAGFFHWQFGGSVQWFDEDWTGTNWLAKNIVQNAAEEYACQGSFRVPPCCNHTTALQTFCLHDFGTGETPTGTSARRTPWFSGRQMCGRTFGDYTLSLGQTFQCKRANLDCQPGLGEGFRPGTLASTMRVLSEHGLSKHMIWMIQNFISRPTGASCWQQWLQQVFCHTRWSTTRMRFWAPCCFVRCWKCRWRIGVMICSIRV